MAIKAALNNVGELLLEQHMKKHVISRMQEGDSEVIEEFLTTVHKLMK